ncbi:MAG: single-stranded DNA-binding protein [Lachnospiraceae bacterium]|nr:single-stranded DNA-binding protein [Lachnospiraceae bacterium]
MSAVGIGNNNTVIVIGKIIEQCVFDHEVYGEGFYTFKVSADRLSENCDELPITISERLIDKELIVSGKAVRISGQLRSYNNFTDKKNKLVLTVFAREIELFDKVPEGNPNSIELNGFICKEPVYRVTPFGREIADVLVAVNRAYKKSDYIPCIAWGRNARYVNKLNVGDNIKLWGRIQSRVYQKKTEDGVEKKTAYEVSVSRIEYIAKEETDQDA